MAKKTIKAQMKQRRDTKANWASTNPVLLDGELGIVSDDPNLYKVGDGTTAWNALPFRGFDGTLAQELGTSPNAVISQQAVTEKINEIESELKGAILTYSALDYQKIPSIAAGETATITLVSSDDNGGILLYGKTNKADSSYLTIGYCDPGASIHFKSDRELNYIKVYNSVGAIPVVIKVEPESTLIGQVSSLTASVNNLEKEVTGTVLTYNIIDYIKVPTIAAGELVKLSVISTDHGGEARFYGKTALTDSDYATLGSGIPGQTFEFISDREINYIKAYNDEDAVPMVIKLAPLNTMEGQFEDLSENIKDVLGYDLLFTSTAYQKTPIIKAGEEFRITLQDIAGDSGIIVYGRTELNTDTYQTIGHLYSKGDSIKTVAGLDINYIRAYQTNLDVYPLNITLTKENTLCERVATLENRGSYTPCMFNPPINFSKPDLKIYDIGNSYTQDAQAYLPNIIEAAGLENNYSLYRAFRPSGSFKTWVDCWNDLDNQGYNITRCAGNDISGIAGDGAPENGELFRKSLTDVKWDVILIHQVSGYSTDFSSWGGNGAGGYLKELIQIIRKTNPQATIGFLMVHSYRSDYGSNTERSSLKRWENIAQATKDFKNAYGVDFIIPYGTAVQNLRASSLNDEFEFSEDGTHLAAGLGDYVAGCCYFQSLFAPRFGISILGNSFTYSTMDESVGGRKAITAETAPVAQKAAMLATYNMWEVMNPDEYKL